MVSYTYAMIKASKVARLTDAEDLIMELKEHIGACSDEVQVNLSTLLRELSGSDWDHSEGLVAKGQSLALELQTMRDKLEDSRQWLVGFYNAMIKMREATSSFAPALSLKEAIDNIVANHTEKGVLDITLEQVLSDLQQLDVRLEVQNPSAVVASILGRHPNVSRRSKGIYEIQVEEVEDESDGLI